MLSNPAPSRTPSRLVPFCSTARTFPSITGSVPRDRALLASPGHRAPAVTPRAREVDAVMRRGTRALEQRGEKPPPSRRRPRDPRAERHTVAVPRKAQPRPRLSPTLPRHPSRTSRCTAHGQAETSPPPGLLPSSSSIPACAALGLPASSRTRWDPRSPPPAALQYRRRPLPSPLLLTALPRVSAVAGGPELLPHGHSDADQQN